MANRENNEIGDNLGWFLGEVQLLDIRPPLLVIDGYKLELAGNYYCVWWSAVTVLTLWRQIFSVNTFHPTAFYFFIIKWQVMWISAFLYNPACTTIRAAVLENESTPVMWLVPVMGGFLYWALFRCSSTSLGVTQMTCWPFQYLTMLRDCSVLMMSLCVMLVIWLWTEQELSVSLVWTQRWGILCSESVFTHTRAYLRSLMDKVPLKSLRISSRTHDQ